MSKFKVGDMVIAKIRTKITGVLGNDTYFVRICGTKITFSSKDLEGVREVEK